MKCCLFIAQCFNLCFKLLDGSDNFITTSEAVKVGYYGGQRKSHTSTSSADDYKEQGNDGESAEGNTEDNFKRYERIRRTLSHSRRRYSTMKRKQRAEREAYKQTSAENTIVASGSHEVNSLPRSKVDDLEASLLLDRDSSAVADREMVELSSNSDKGVNVDDSLKASKTFSSLRRGIYYVCVH